MRDRWVALACAAGALLSVSALADERADCVAGKDNLVAIRGCSEIIRRDPKDAAAYHLRGNALARNNDLGQAIVDFSKAIALDPGLAAAYDSRASAYVAKGDYTRAVADATKAAEVARASKAKAKRNEPALAIAKASSAPAQAPDDTKPTASSSSAPSASASSASPKEPTTAASTNARPDWKSTIFDPSGGGRRGE